MTGCGPLNPNWRNLPPKICEFCKKEYKSYQKTQRFCSKSCSSKRPDNIERLKRMTLLPKKRHTSGRKDLNHYEIINALRDVGVKIIDTSSALMEPGCPDFVSVYNGKVTLAEIKNPKTKYGRSGFNKNQKIWNDNWRGTKPVIVSSVKEAIELILGQTLPE